MSTPSTPEQFAAAIGPLFDRLDEIQAVEPTPTDDSPTWANDLMAAIAADTHKENRA